MTQGQSKNVLMPLSQSWGMLVCPVEYIGQMHLYFKNKKFLQDMDKKYLYYE
jgi:hypothetical protein